MPNSYNNLNEKYNIDQPIVLKYAKELIDNGLKLNLSQIKDVEALALEIKRCYHE